MNREKAGRLGIYDTIKNILSYDGNTIHTYDEATTLEVSDEKIYVLLTQQTANNDSDYTCFRWRCVQTIEIVSKQIGSVSKDIADDISEQIEQAIIYPRNKPGQGGMTAQAGWEFEDTLLESVNYTEFRLEENLWEITKILNISYIITKI